MGSACRPCRAGILSTIRYVLNPVSTLSHVLLHQATRRPDAVAVYYQNSGVTFADLESGSRSLARALSGLGVARGDRVAVWLPNVPAWHLCLLACAQLGATVVAINTRFRSAELSHILGTAEPRVVVFWPGFHGIDFVSILGDCDRSALAATRAFLRYSETDDDRTDRMRGIPAHDFRRAIEGPGLDPGQHARDPEDGCVIFTTSGTTGTPKLALHTQASITGHAFDTVRAFGYGASDACILVATPMCGTSGFGMAVAALAAGRPQVVAPVFDERETAGLIRNHKVTHTHATHHIIRRLFDAVREERPFPSLRLVNCGTGAPALVDSAAERGMCIIGVYGSTEVQARFSRQDEELPPQERAVGGGIPVSGRAIVRVRCLQTGRLLPHGESGELEIRAPSQLAMYLGGGALDRKAFTDDGFARTGDLGHTLPDGRFVFQSRIGDVLRLSGFLVSAGEIERVVERHPAVSTCQVVGVETKDGMRPFAFVQLRSGQRLDPRDLVEFCRRKMAAYKTPIAFHAVDEFPVTEGPNQTKVQKAKLREMAGALLSTRPCA